MFRKQVISAEQAKEAVMWIAKQTHGARRAAMAHVVAGALALAATSSCGAVGPIVNSVNNVADTIDKAIAQINAVSSSWQTVLKDTVGQITDGAQSTIRNEIQTLLDNSVGMIE